MKKIKNYIDNIFDNIIIYRKKKVEVKKFNDARRKKIYTSVILTNEQKQEIDKLYINNYGKKIPYTWHRHFTAFTGKFDSRYFPELLYIPEFEHYMNQKKSYIHVYSDKNVLPKIANSVGVKMPITIVGAAEGIYFNKKYEEITRDEIIVLLANQGEVFCKPTIDSSSGNGCFIANFESGIDLISKRKVEDILTSLGENFVIQERLKCHKTITNIYSKSVNTFRIMTYRWNDKYFHVPIIMRIGQGGNYLDNAHAGGIFVAVDDDGKMHNQAFTEFKTIYTEHPDTGIKFKDCKIELLPNVIIKAKKMHAAMSQVGVINWDFTIDDVGEPVLLEANMRAGSIWLFQIAHGCGAFGENTDDILRWLKKMRYLEKSERAKYIFGKDCKYN